MAKKAKVKFEVVDKPEIQIRDAKRPLIIKVTKGDVSKSAKQTQHRCAVANSICRQVEHAVEARVHKSVTYVKMSSGVWFRYKTPAHLRTELALFDRAGIFDPGEYKLGVPTGSLALNHRPSHGPKKNRPTGKPKRIMHFLEGMRPDASKKFAGLD